MTRRPLPLEQQDKRAEAHIEPEDWTTWLSGDLEVARELLVPAPREFYDQDDATRTDAALAAIDA